MSWHSFQNRFGGPKGSRRRVVRSATRDEEQPDKHVACRFSHVSKDTLQVGALRRDADESLMSNQRNSND